MAITLTHIGRSPAQPQFGLDTFIEHYKCNVAADLVLIDSSVPQRGDAHPDYAFMFVTDRYVTETGPSSSALDVNYMGCMATSEGNPVLPPSVTEDNDAVVSASSSRGSSGQILASPVSVQFYAPTRKLTFITYGAEGVKNTVSDPSGTPTIIAITVNDTNYTPTGVLQDVASIYFTQLINDTIQSVEIVAGKFWQNIEQKTITLIPFLFNAPSSSNIITLFAPGSGYTVGNSLTITDGSGHSASITVASVGIGASITGFTVVSNTYNYTTPSPQMASGGSGTGAGFFNVHIP